MTLHLHRSYEDSDRFWSVDCDGVNVGSIVHDVTRPEQAWRWSNVVQRPAPEIGKGGMGETREDCMREFREAWDRYREWLGDERWAGWAAHMAMVTERSRRWKRQKVGEEPGGN